MPPGFNMRGGEKAPKIGASLRDLKKDSTVFRLFRFIFKHYADHNSQFIQNTVADFKGSAF